VKGDIDLPDAGSLVTVAATAARKDSGPESHSR
jgi:hypothetical protein